MKIDLRKQVSEILSTYDPASPRAAADGLRALWLRFEPKSTAGIKAELREQQQTVGIPVPILTAIGEEIARVARTQVASIIPLMHLLWEEYGREGKGVAVTPLGRMELIEPEIVVPLLMELCRTCVTWEDADRLAMAALEPIVRKEPESWLGVLESWLNDENKWVRRAAITVAGRLPMKRPAYTTHCLALAERLLLDEETDVRKAVSFAVRLCARGDAGAVRDFLARHVPPEDPAATWVLCDAIRSMANKLLPEFVPLLPSYERWAASPDLAPQERRSVESAVKSLHGARSGRATG